MQTLSGSRKYTSVSPHYVQKSREQHYFGDDGRGHIRHVHDMLCASILGATGHVCTGLTRQISGAKDKWKTACLRYGTACEEALELPLEVEEEDQRTRNMLLILHIILGTTRFTGEASSFQGACSTLRVWTQRQNPHCTQSLSDDHDVFTDTRVSRMKEKKNHGATLVQGPYDHPTTKFRLREERQAEKEDRSSNEKESRMIAKRLEFQTFNSKQSQHCQPPNQGKPCPAANC
eukprot:1146192-Pelagomonas_calceolata.AAC.1